MGRLFGFPEAVIGALAGAGIGYFVGGASSALAGAVGGFLGGGNGGSAASAVAGGFLGPFIARRPLAVCCPLLGSTFGAIAAALIWQKYVGADGALGKVWFVLLCYASAMMGSRTGSYWGIKLSYSIDAPMRSALHMDSSSVVEWVRQAARVIGTDERMAAEEYVTEVRGTEMPITPIFQIFEQLVHSRQAAVPFLIASLKHPNVFVRSGSASSLGSIGPDAKEAVSALIGAMHDVLHVRAEAAEALGSMGTTDDRVLPTLIAALSDEHDAVQARACSALRKLGSEAKPAVPALRALLDGESWTVRDEASLALSVIEAGEAQAAIAKQEQATAIGATGARATSERAPPNREAAVEVGDDRGVGRRAKVHCRYCDQTYVTTISTGTCMLCGRSGGVEVGAEPRNQ